MDGFTDITGNFTMDPPMDLTPAYSITGTFSAKGLSDWLDHGEKRGLPKGLRLGRQVGDGMMGPYDPGDLTENDPTACFSGHETEDIALTLPAGTKVTGLPDDFKIETAAITFTAHWSFKDGVVTLHREFRSKTSQALCTGALRKDIAATLKKIADGYDKGLRLTRSVDSYSSTIRSDATNVDALIQRGNAYGDNGQYDLALKDYEEALRLDPKSSWALNARGTTYLRMGKLDLAIADYSRALALEPDFEAVWYNRGLAYSRQSAWDKAVADFSATLKLNSKNVEALIDRGRAYSFQKKLDLAMADYDAAIALEPNHPRAHSNRASLRLRRNEAQGALEDCNIALKSDPKNTWALILRGTAWRMKFNNEAALADFNAALAIDPKYDDVLKARAFLYRDTNRPALALADLDAALAAAPNDADMLFLRADVHSKLKHWDLAIADYDKVLAQRPDYEQAHNGRLSALVHNGQGAVALRDAEALIAAHPGKGWPYLMRSVVKREMGDHTGANADVDLALKIDPNLNPSATAPVVRMTPKPAGPVAVFNSALAEGTQAAGRREFTAAAASFERAIKQGAPDSLVLPMLCKALAHSARLDDAAYQCSRALQLQENDGELLEARGYAYFRQGKFREALSDFDAAVRTFSRDARYLYERGVTKKKLGDASGDADIAKAKQMDAGVAGEVPVKIAL
jgi:tetratricopeptide (TPR) repeat protein